MQTTQTTPLYVNHQVAAQSYFELLPAVLSETKISRGMCNLLAVVRLIDLENYLATSSPGFTRDEELAKLLDDLGITYDFVIFTNNSEYKANNLESIALAERNEIVEVDINEPEVNKTYFLRTESVNKVNFGDTDLDKDSMWINLPLPKTADITSIQDYSNYLTINFTVESDDETAETGANSLVLTFYKTNTGNAQDINTIPGQFIGCSVFVNSKGEQINYMVYVETDVEVMS